MIKEILTKSILEDEERSKNRKRSGKWSPSSLGRCYRYQYWNRKDEPKSDPIPVNVLLIFKVGKIFHEFFQDFFLRSSREILIESDDVLGFADIVEGDEVIDFKTVRSYAFKKISKKDYKVEEDKIGECLQIMLYAMYLNKSKGRLVFINKDDLGIVEFVIKLESWKDRVLEELSILRGYWSQEKLPPPLPRAYGGKECNYCSFKTKCKEMQSATKT